MIMEILTGSGGGGDSVLFCKIYRGDFVLVNKKDGGILSVGGGGGGFCPTLLSYISSKSYIS